VSEPSDDQVTILLQQASKGSRDAVDRLLPLVYDELRRIASDYLYRERADHTLQPTAIVHEAYLRLVNQQSAGWNDRTQFFAVAAKIMRRILVDHARSRKAAKRGGGKRKSEFDDALAVFEERAIDLVALDEVLNKLAVVDERKSRVVELRFFGGLSVEETSRVLNVPLRTVERDWTFAKAWLRSKLGDI
jgi:RNA polymerase sigma factor (TIGR02999 family)